VVKWQETLRQAQGDALERVYIDDRPARVTHTPQDCARTLDADAIDVSGGVAVAPIHGTGSRL